jgi:uncharacterized protein (TIGR02246 family)
MQAKDDMADVESLASRWQTAWNQHDMHALGELFTDDADFVNVFGARWKGSQEIEQAHHDDTRRGSPPPCGAIRRCVSSCSPTMWH